MVRLYAIDIGGLPDPKEDPSVLHNIGVGRRVKAMNFLRAEDRKRCLGAGILLAAILTLYGESPDDITYGAEGKPLAKNVCFNLSHSGDLAVCAVSAKAVGCDIEKLGEEPEGVAQAFFHRNEADRLQSFRGAERSEMFYRLWTLKESYVKMTGEGMKLPLRDFEILQEKDVIRVRRRDKILPCFMAEYNIPGYKVSVCAEEADFNICVEYIDR